VATTISHNPEETFAYGFRLGEGLRKGEIIALCGELGAGKTQLSKGLAAGLGCDPNSVASPTFTLIHEYMGGRVPMFHFDFYRLESEEEALQLGFDDYLAGEGVVVIEWADKFPALLPPAARWLRLRHGEGDARVIEEQAGAANGP
jgi:tRNA threonylcarbamoyladenosine biosynthesis protein TsaE